ncbi:DUF4405 domain-containing protein [Priestia megaterium]|uniref:DUF4405 domain-containing protein n=1 Tax=Priestia megaterium TaxID=1404 RepID=UPI00257112C4|nr:DUF4405 domain-containing protein [Priestia megaterium]WJD83560.1 DUF4405 domain-containing protein [Priestia megaterium]
MKKKSLMYIKFCLDILMAVTFVLFFNKQVFGGLAFHEIAGLVIAVAFITHVLLNWQWVKKVTVKLFDPKLPRKTKLGYFLNLMLLITMLFIMVSGILISRVVFPNINIGNEQWFKTSHISISYLVLILVAAHVGLHWKWVINVSKNIVKSKTSKPIFGVLAKVATVALLLFGIYQMYSTHFVTRVEGIAGVFNNSSSQMHEGNKERVDFAKANGPMEDHDLDAQKFENKDTQTASGNFNKFDGDERPNHSINGKGDGFESPNPLSVISTYFGIMSVFIIIIYYIEKFSIRNKRKKKDLVAGKEGLPNI